MSSQRYDVMMVADYEVQGQTKSRWTKVGAAFTNRDGSIGVQLDAYPTNGRLVLQIPMTKEEREARFAQNQGGGGKPQGKAGGMNRRAKSAPAPVAQQPYQDDQGGGGGEEDLDFPFPE